MVDPRALRITVSPLLTETVPFPRSPARAKRRARLGHPQHMVERPMKKAFSLPDGSLAMHPVTFHALKAELERRKASAAPPPPPPPAPLRDTIAPDGLLDPAAFTTWMNRLLADLGCAGIRPPGGGLSGAGLPFPRSFGLLDITRRS